jgi:trehalose 6-phosphate phosphatase
VRESAPPLLDTNHHALFLDFDGTFVDFAPEPDAIRLRTGSIELLQRLAKVLGGALAVITGRRLADLDRHLAPLTLPASGVHGMEFRPQAAELRVSPPSPHFEVVRRRLSKEMARGDPLSIEDKGGAIVLHFRKHPKQAPRAEALARSAVDGLADLHVVAGDAIFEIRQRGITKAEAIARFMEEPPFAGRAPVFVGDDSTDEDGFRAAAAARGFGVKVGPGESAADYRLRNVANVHAWLSASLR